MRRDPSESALEFSSLLSSCSSSSHYNLRHFHPVTFSFFSSFLPLLHSSFPCHSQKASPFCPCFLIFFLKLVKSLFLSVSLPLHSHLSLFHSQWNTDEPETAPLSHPLLSKRSPVRMNRAQHIFDS